jgi:hypothetical protein
MDRPEKDIIAMRTPQNRSHGSRIETQRAYRSRRAARAALNLCGRDIRYEEFLKESRGSIAIENQVRDILRHGV